MDYQEKAKSSVVLAASGSDHASKLCDLFFELFLSEMSPEDLREHTKDAWQKIAYHGFAFLDNKTPNISVRVYCPQETIKGWAASGTAIEISHPHLPFLIDSLYAALVTQKHHIGSFLHLLLKTSRSPEGTLQSMALGKNSLNQPNLESFLYIQLEDHLSLEERLALQHSLEAVIQDVCVSVHDWQAMRHRIPECLEGLESSYLSLTLNEQKEQSDFLKWIDDGFFTFLGYRFYDVAGRTHSSKTEALGIVKRHKGSFFGLDEETEKTILNQSIGDYPYFNITKTMAQSKVHRPVPMDVIRIVSFDKEGALRGEHQFFGLFTAAVYNAPLNSIPLIRQKVVEVLEICQGYEHRQLMYILESLPRDILFHTSSQEIVTLIQSIMRLKEKHRVSLFVLPDPLGHFISSLVYIPRDRYTASLATQSGNMLADCYKGALISEETHIGGDLSFARVHYLISTDSHPQHKIVCDRHSTELALTDLSLSWEERLKQVGREEHNLNDGSLSGLFSSAYQEHFSVHEAIKDIPFIKEALKTTAKTIRLYHGMEEGTELFHVKLFSPQEPLFLSDIFPKLENMGLRILSEASYKSGAGSKTVWIHHFRALPLVPSSESFAKIYHNFLDVLTKVIHSKTEDDSFNHLVISANLSSHHLLLVRAYYRYMRQIGWPFMRPAIVSVFEKYPSVLKNLGRLFYAQFNPEDNQSNPSEETLLSQLTKDLQSIENADDESLLTGFLTLIRATQRTNFFQKDRTGSAKEYVSLKMDPSLIEPLQDTKPLYEVFVYAPFVEAIHLRSGKVSRGGIRWSDRRVDYRKEVLELMKAQLVKNAVIVPMGAKGGFYVKTPLEHLSFSEKQEEGIRCYKTMICGFLDITDNLVDGKIISPHSVKCRDGDDPYLVVAADKGTATFSDIANGLSLDYGFWLGDAFASGGSAGYDHKKMAITSRGAWEAVKRHFRECDIDIEKPFTTLGVGDMSGDVFGNGMLYSDQIRLVAAFNHSHIFIDPTPDLKKSCEERKRLFNIPRSQWSDYNPTLISTGGGVFERRAKTITLSPEAQRLLDIRVAEIKPALLIQSILKAKADLLWFGGIGTYVKDEKETDMDVGDRANDGVRVNGHDIQARVVAEGANLALTQKGRIAYAQKGGKINRDSVDNSAGVDCSDHEVNIKILFQDILKAGVLDEVGRNTLLKEMTDDVARLVLRHNYLQTQAISMIESRGYKALARQNRLIRFFETQNRINREQEALPSEDEVERRLEKKIGLTRPEIAVLVSHTKLYLYELILASQLPENLYLEPHLTAYFPPQLQEKFGSFIKRHPLRRELIATTEANLLVNRFGTTFLFELERRSGKTVEDLIRFMAILRDIFQLDTYWAAIEGLDGTVSCDIQNRLLSLMISFNEKALELALQKEVFHEWLDKSFPSNHSFKYKEGSFKKQESGLISEEVLDHLEKALNGIGEGNASLLEELSSFLNTVKEILL